MLKRLVVLTLLLALALPLAAETASAEGISFALFRLPIKSMLPPGQTIPISDLLCFYIRSENRDTSAFKVTVKYEHDGQLRSDQASGPVTSPSGSANIELFVPDANARIKSVLIEELKTTKSQEFLEFR